MPPWIAAASPASAPIPRMMLPKEENALLGSPVRYSTMPASVVTPAEIGIALAMGVLRNNDRRNFRPLSPEATAVGAIYNAIVAPRPNQANADKMWSRRRRAIRKFMVDSFRG